MHSLNIGGVADQNKKPPALPKSNLGSANRTNYNAPRIEYDAAELEKKSPEELDRILKDMEDYHKASY
jgi:hypothetical protein